MLSHMAETGNSGISAAGRWVGWVGLLVLGTPRLGLGQHSAAVQATVRVVVSAAPEHRALTAELARRWGGRAEVMKAQGSLALVRLRVARPAPTGGAAAPSKPVAIVDIHYLRN